MSRLPSRLSILQVFPICNHSVSFFSLSHLLPSLIKCEQSTSSGQAQGQSLGTWRWVGQEGVHQEHRVHWQKRKQMFTVPIQVRGEPRGREQAGSEGHARQKHRLAQAASHSFPDPALPPLLSFFIFLFHIFIPTKYPARAIPCQALC